MGSIEEEKQQQHAPEKKKNTPLQIPVIDISPSNADAPAQLLSAASQHGFIFIKNDPHTGIPAQDIADIFRLSQEFFASPVHVKEQVAIGSKAAGKNHGWLRRGVEKLDPGKQERADVKEAFNIGEHISNTLQQPLPTPLQPHADKIIAFQNRCHDLCPQLFRQFARALALDDEEWFVARHDSGKGVSSTVLRMLYYPKVDDAETGVDIRAGAHSDFGSITLLFQMPGQPGLEIWVPEGDGDGKDGEGRGRWEAVPVDPESASTSSSASNSETSTPTAPLPILINFGDLLEDWTGGLFKSTLHRVVFPPGEQGDRYSVAYFCQPLDDATLDPVPSELVREFTRRTGKTSQREGGRVLTARDHLMERLAATYTIGKAG